MAKANLTSQRLRELLTYDPETGIFTNKVKRGNRGIQGAVTGSLRSNGYIAIAVEATVYYSHRLAWLYMTGDWPKFDIDHKDGNKTNNRFENLRDVTTTVNTQNRRKAKSDSSTGVIGVTKHRDKFTAWIAVNKKKIYLGVFDILKEGSRAYLEHKRKYHEGCLI
jgi:hypothetical protein